MAAAAAEKPAGKANLIVTVAALTVLAVVGGGLVGKLIIAKLQIARPVAEPVKPFVPYAGDTVVRELPASVTNLADPPEMRLRIQVAIVFDKKGHRESEPHGRADLGRSRRLCEDPDAEPAAGCERPPEPARRSQ